MKPAQAGATAHLGGAVAQVYPDDARLENAVTVVVLGDHRKQRYGVGVGEVVEDVPSSPSVGASDPVSDENADPSSGLIATACPIA